ncbi:MAG: SdrD B-like domain-containing protein [Candidatus Thorarchaeota archaeon]
MNHQTSGTLNGSRCHKYEDWDGTRSSDEKPLEGWEIQLYKDSFGSLSATAFTDAEGYYEFVIMYPGEYAIMEVLQEGWVETYPILASTPGPVLGYDFTLAVSGVDWENMDFWNSGARTYITDTSDCRDIVTEFRLVVTPDFSEGEEHYKIASTNPGGFYFNIIFHAWTDGEIEIHYDLGYGFIEHGGQPIHAYVWTDLDSDGVVDWCDGEVTCIDKKKIVSIDYENGIIVFDGLEECNDILVTIHMKFDKKSFQDLEKDWIEDNLLGKDYEFSAFVEGCWSSTTILTEISNDIKKLKACAIFGVVLEEAEHDEPVSGAIFRLYKDGVLLKARTTGEDGIFYFDKLDDGTYYLDIELPLGLILQDPEYDDTVIYLSIQIKLQDGDFISIGVYIKTGVSDPEGEPPDVSTTMEQIWIPSASSDSTYTSDPTNRASRDRFDGVENILAMVASSPFVGIAIAAAWFGSVVSLAFVYNTRTRRRTIQAAISRPTRYGMQWSIEDSDSE